MAPMECVSKLENIIYISGYETRLDYNSGLNLLRSLNLLHLKASGPLKSATSWQNCLLSRRFTVSAVIIVI